MQIKLRLEEEKDYRIVEELTREAFWNIHFPGADEHLLVHKIRGAKEFVKELDFVACIVDDTVSDQENCDEEIVGNIVYAESTVIDNGKEHLVLTFGPVSVLPEYQSKGIGSKLINHTIELSKKMGYKAIIIYGDPEYYKRFGFKVSKEYRITNKDGKFPAALLALELYPDALNGIQGVFDEGKAYEIDPNESLEFDKGFVKKEKGWAKSQDRFNELSAVFL